MPIAALLGSFIAQGIGNTLVNYMFIVSALGLLIVTILLVQIIFQL